MVSARFAPWADPSAQKSRLRLVSVRSPLRKQRQNSSPRQVLCGKLRSLPFKPGSKTAHRHPRLCASSPVAGKHRKNAPLSSTFGVWRRFAVQRALQDALNDCAIRKKVKRGSSPKLSNTLKATPRNNTPRIKSSSLGPGQCRTVQPAIPRPSLPAGKVCTAL